MQKVILSFHKVSWYVDGSVVGGETSNTLPSSYFAKGQSVYAEVNASDNFGTSTQQSNTLVVENTPAEPPLISIDGGNGIEGEQDLICLIDILSNDVMGTIRFPILLNGNSTEIPTLVLYPQPHTQMIPYLLQILWPIRIGCVL